MKVSYISVPPILVGDCHAVGPFGICSVGAVEHCRGGVCLGNIFTLGRFSVYVGNVIFIKRIVARVFGQCSLWLVF